MTTPMPDLIQRIEAAEGADRAIDEAIQCALVSAEIEWSNIRQCNIYHKDGRWISIGEIKPYTASIDAVLTLVPEGYDWSLDNFDGDQGRPHAWVCKDGPFYNATAATSALALCAAALKAHIKRNEG